MSTLDHCHWISIRGLCSLPLPANLLSGRSLAVCHGICQLDAFAGRGLVCLREHGTGALHVFGATHMENIEPDGIELWLWHFIVAPLDNVATAAIPCHSRIVVPYPPHDCVVCNGTKSQYETRSIATVDLLELRYGRPDRGSHHETVPSHSATVAGQHFTLEKSGGHGRGTWFGNPHSSDDTIPVETCRLLRDHTGIFCNTGGAIVRGGNLGRLGRECHQETIEPKGFLLLVARPWRNFGSFRLLLLCRCGLLQSSGVEPLKHKQPKISSYTVL